MPFLAEDEEKQQTEQQGAQNISGQSSVINQQSQSAQPQKSSGSYTNLQKYLDANKEQAGQMGSQVVGSVEQSGQQAQSDINKFQSNVKPPVQAETAETAQARLKNPTMSPTEYQKLQQTGGYEGPRDVSQVEGYNQATQSAQQAAEKVKGIATEAGRTNLVAQQFARPTYSQGQKKLDTMLVSKNPESRAQFENVGQKWSGLDNLLNTAVTQSGQQVNQNVATAAANKETIRAAEQQTKEQFRQQLQAQADRINQQRAQKTQDLQNQIDSGNYTQELANALGLSSGASLYDFDLNSYFNPNLTQVSQSQAADQNQRQYWSNLMNLIGDQDNTLDLNAQMPEDSKFDKNRFQKEYSNRAAEVEGISKETLISPRTRGAATRALGSMQDMISALSNTAMTDKDIENYLADRVDNPNYMGKQYGTSRSPGWQEIIQESVKNAKNFINQYGINKRFGLPGGVEISDSSGKISSGKVY